jgi:hypothetical protein
MTGQANRAEPPSRGVTSRTRDAGPVIGAAGWHRWQIERSLSWLGGAAVQLRWGIRTRGFFAFALVVCLNGFNHPTEAHAV